MCGEKGGQACTHTHTHTYPYTTRICNFPTSPPAPTPAHYRARIVLRLPFPNHPLPPKPNLPADLVVRTTTTPYSAIPRAPNPVIIQTHLVFVRLGTSRAPGTGTPPPLPPLAALAALAAAAAAAPSSAASTPTTAPAAAASAAAAAATRRRPRRVAPAGHNPQHGQKAGRGEERRGAGNRVRVRPSPEVCSCYLHVACGSSEKVGRGMG